MSVKMSCRMAETVVLLHGFAGTRHAWDLVAARLDPERYRPHALDLRGHGEARDARPITFAACTADVLEAAPARFILCGYSLGGRVALHVALAAPERVSRLVLVASTAGRKCAAAVPLVHVTAAGRPVAFATPSAKNPATRSSTCDQHGTRPSRTVSYTHLTLPTN